jgi:DNA mismatch repair protein MutS2
LPAPDIEPVPALPPTPHVWRLGERARSLTGGWEGRIVALERDGTRASLEAGGIRVMIDVDDLVPAVGGGPADDEPAGSGVAVDRGRAVALSLDLRGARVEDALDALDRYLDEASLAGLTKVVIIHGQGTGALRDAVRRQAGANGLVTSVRAGHRGEGGDGATIVEF